MASFYWERHLDGLFATLIAVAATYLHPENYDLDSLKSSQSARRTRRSRRTSASSSLSRQSGLERLSEKRKGAAVITPSRLSLFSCVNPTRYTLKHELM